MKFVEQFKWMKELGKEIKDYLASNTQLYFKYLLPHY